MLRNSAGAGVLGMRGEADHGGPDLGRRAEGAGRQAQQQLAAAAPLRQHRQPAIGVGVGAAQMRSATSCWNISAMPSSAPAPRSQPTSSGVATL